MFIFYFYNQHFFFLPKDIETKKKALSDIQNVIDEPAMCQSDLDQLNRQVGVILFYSILFYSILFYSILFFVEGVFEQYMT